MPWLASPRTIHSDSSPLLSHSDPNHFWAVSATWPALSDRSASVLAFRPSTTVVDLQHDLVNRASSPQPGLFSIAYGRAKQVCFVRDWGRPTRDLADLRRGDRGGWMQRG